MADLFNIFNKKTVLFFSKCLESGASLIYLTDTEHVDLISQLLMYFPTAALFEAPWATGLFSNPFNLFISTGSGR
jgi:hypothetical protein